MTPRDFVYWLQGFMEIENPVDLNQVQTNKIKNHLNLVFKHSIDSETPDPDGKLQAVHDGLNINDVLGISENPGSLTEKPKQTKNKPFSQKPSKTLYRC